LRKLKTTTFSLKKTNRISIYNVNYQKITRKELNFVKPLTTSNTSEKCDFMKDYQFLEFLPISN